MNTRTNSIQPQVQEAAHAAVRLAGQAEDLAVRGLDAVRDGAQHLRSRAADATDRGVQYVQEEPVKAVMIAAAAGAALMVLAQWATSRRRERA